MPLEPLTGKHGFRRLEDAGHSLLPDPALLPLADVELTTLRLRLYREMQFCRHSIKAIDRVLILRAGRHHGNAVFECPQADNIPGGGNRRLNEVAPSGEIGIFIHRLNGSGHAAPQVDRLQGHAQVISTVIVIFLTSEQLITG